MMDRETGRMALRTCATATDGTGYKGFRAAVITLGVYVLSVRLCLQNIGHKEFSSSVILAGPWGPGILR